MKLKIGLKKGEAGVDLIRWAYSLFVLLAVLAFCFLSVGVWV